jgi:uncharacterized membrane protein
MQDQVHYPKEEKISLGERLADLVADAVGSWMFIIYQSGFMALWITGNLMGWLTFDPYPFILLNLFLSFQAAYTAPFILMSQGRQSAKDRKTIEKDLRSDLRTEKHIKQVEHRLEELHAKMDEVLKHQHHKGDF